MVKTVDALLVSEPALIANHGRPLQSAVRNLGPFGKPLGSAEEKARSILSGTGSAGASQNPGVMQKKTSRHLSTPLFLAASAVELSLLSFRIGTIVYSGVYQNSNQCACVITISTYGRGGFSLSQ